MSVASALITRARKLYEGDASLTQRALAIRLGVTQGSICQWAKLYGWKKAKENSPL